MAVPTSIPTPAPASTPKKRLHTAALAASAASLVAGLVSVTAPAHAAAVQVRLVTANLDFNISQAKVAADWKNEIAPNADIVFLQEAKNVKLASFVDTSTWIVRQDTSSSDRAGSALVIRRSAVKSISDYGLVEGVAASSCPGGGIETRWISKAQVRLTNGRLIRIASLHMPPGRCQTGPSGPYNRMAGNVVAFAKRTDMPTLLGADWNKVVDADPNDIGKQTGLKPYGPNSASGDATRIDGFYASKAFSATGLKHLADDNSDHNPVQMKVTIAAP